MPHTAFPLKDCVVHVPESLLLIEGRRPPSLVVVFVLWLLSRRRAGVHRSSVFMEMAAGDNKTVMKQTKSTNIKTIFVITAWQGKRRVLDSSKAVTRNFVQRSVHFEDQLKAPRRWAAKTVTGIETKARAKRTHKEVALADDDML